MPLINPTLIQYLKSSSVHIFIYFRLIFGCYSHVSNSKVKCLLLKIYCASFTIAAVLIFLDFLTTFGLRTLTVIEYVSMTVLNLFITEKSIIKYCQNIKTANSMMGIKGTSVIPRNFLIIAVLIILSIIALSIVVVLQGTTFTVLQYSSFSLMLLVKEINNLSIVMVFAVLHNRMKVIRKSMETNTIPVNIIARNEIKLKIKLIRKSLLMYKQLLDNLLTVHRHVQCLECVTLIASLPKFIWLLHRLLKNIILLGDMNIALRIALELTYYILCVSCPAILAEMSVTEVNRTRKNITNQLLHCSDESLRFELEIILQYITRRPFNYMICRAIPFDGSLPIALLSFNFTYVIIIMQLNTFKL